jgi:hypothetical protein
MCESLVTIIFAFLATLAAFFSAIAALLSAKSASTANKIAIHNEGLKIYKALLRFQSSLFSNKVKSIESRLFILDEYIQLSYFYLPKVHTELDKIWEKTELIIQDVNSLNMYHHTDKQYKEINGKISSDISSLRNFCSNISVEIKNHLKITT